MKIMNSQIPIVRRSTVKLEDHDDEEEANNGANIGKKMSSAKKGNF